MLIKVAMNIRHCCKNVTPCLSHASRGKAARRSPLVLLPSLLKTRHMNSRKQTNWHRMYPDKTRDSDIIE
ncbi:hypothetical protein E2C01_074581 [Portunus trituberculatus]|uniref:Uncharacterized protein n=1 Tax=Portunus trituberculatus TaxID=210409 RepID=A0A5B7IGN1_PORTR|nr:hypothetical protein [Portunus trituberculatus]